MLVTASLAIAFLQVGVPTLVSLALGVLALTLGGVRASRAKRRAERRTAACLAELQKRHARDESESFLPSFYNGLRRSYLLNTPF